MATLTHADNTKQIISELTGALQVSETYLAGFLGVTEKSLNEWKRLKMGELTPKAHRLTRLYQVLRFLYENHTDIPVTAYKTIVENGRVPIDLGDEEDSTISLLNFILTEPDSKYWIPCVEKVVTEYKQHMKITAEKPHESHKSAQKFA